MSEGLRLNCYYNDGTIYGNNIFDPIGAGPTTALFNYWGNCSNWNITYNNIYGASMDYLVYNDYVADMNVTYNYWGTVNGNEIMTKMYDQDDDPSKGVVYYNPVLDGPGGSPV